MVRTPKIVAVTLVLGALWMFLAERVGSQAKREPQLGCRDAFLVGVAQAAALVPGVSRSGVTIGAGLLLGFQRAEIARFTFLLSVPAILAAAAKSGSSFAIPACRRRTSQVFAIGMATSGDRGLCRREIPPAVPHHAPARRVRVVSPGARGRDRRVALRR